MIFWHRCLLLRTRGPRPSVSAYDHHDLCSCGSRTWYGLYPPASTRSTSNTSTMSRTTEESQTSASPQSGSRIQIQFAETPCSMHGHRLLHAHVCTSQIYIFVQRSLLCSVVIGGAPHCRLHRIYFSPPVELIPTAYSSAIPSNLVGPGKVAQIVDPPCAARVTSRLHTGVSIVKRVPFLHSCTNNAKGKGDALGASPGWIPERADSGMRPSTGDCRNPTCRQPVKREQPSKLLRLTQFSIC